MGYKTLIKITVIIFALSYALCHFGGEIAASAEEQAADKAAVTEETVQPAKSAESADKAQQEAVSPETDGDATAPMTMGDPAAPSAAGGAFSSFITEKFQTDLTTGAATVGVPIVVPPGRKGVQPNLALSYSGNNGNAWCGTGWSLDVGSIQRSTKKGVPAYDAADIYVFSGAELVKIAENPDATHEYRAKIESQFMRFVYDTAADTWAAYDKAGTKYIFGGTADSKIGNGNATFQWSLNKVIDLHANYMLFNYEADQGHLYLKRINYTGNEGAAPLLPRHEVLFNREVRTDKPVSYRAGFTAAVTARLREIAVYTDGSIDWWYEIGYEYSPETNRSLIRAITLYDKDGNSLPPKTFTYQSDL